MKSWILGKSSLAVFAHSSVLVGDLLYLSGGADENGKITNTIQIFDFKSDTFEIVDPKTDLTARQFHSSVFHENKIYIFGGKSGSYKNDLIEIDVKSNSVTSVSTSGAIPSPRFGHSACVWNNKMFIYGGYDTDSATTSQIYQYDFATSSWSTVTAKGNSMPPSRYQCGSCVLDNQWYIFGGSSGVSPYNDIWSFEFESNIWREVKSHGKWPSPRWACSLSAVSSSKQDGSSVDGLYVFGGKTKTKVPESNQLFRLDLNTGQWTQINVKETSRYYHTCVVRDSQLILAGGSTSQKNAVGSVVCIDLRSISNISLLSSLLKPTSSKSSKDSKSNRSYFDYLPIETFMEVLNHLDAIDLVRGSRVNRYWNKHTQNENLWRVLWEVKYKNTEKYLFKEGERGCYLNFLKNFKLSDTQNRLDFNVVKAYNEWVDQYNSHLPNPNAYYGSGSCNTKSTNSNNNNDTTHASANRYKSVILLQLFFSSQEAQNRAKTIQKYNISKGLLFDYNYPNNGPIHACKLVISGDGAVGKTSFLIRLCAGAFPEEYIPTVFDNYNLPVVWNRIPFSVSVWDTAGPEEYDRLRPLSYPGTTFFVVCFSVANRNSYENIRCKWMPELNHHCPNVPKILIATKVDLRTNPDMIQKLEEKKQTMITTKEGEALAKEIGAIAYVETSALRDINVFRVIEEGVNYTLQSFEGIVEDNKKCTIM